MKNHCQKGIALITALLVLLLISSIIVGLSWLVMTDAKLGHNNADRQNAFYGAESGMEAITANLASDFNLNYDLSAADITAIVTNPPTDIPNISYLKSDGTSGYEIDYPGQPGNPVATNGTILSGPYTGLTALLTPYTLFVTARTPLGSEVKLQRTVQTVAIPVFQFGVFSDTDLSFFAGPDFEFGGRLHTNGNLWLAENGGTLTLDDKVTAVGQIIRTNLENKTSTTSSYNTTVQITTNPGSGSYATLSTSQGSTSPGSTSYFGNITSSLWEPQFSKLATGTFNGNIAVGVTPLNLGIATPALGGQSIDLIRLPLPGESASNFAKYSERMYSQASVRILLSDYGPSGTCTDSDIMGLPQMSAGTPIDLAQLASTTSTPIPFGGGVYPLPASAATSATTYTASDGYWVKANSAIITGCLKIDYQTTAGGAFVDVTSQILKQGFTGKNINPQIGKNGVPAWVAPPAKPTTLPTAQVGTMVGTGSACADPSTSAIIRLARLRDNPSNATSANGWCGTALTTKPTDYWPNVLFDTREGTLRDQSVASSTGTEVTLAGAMYYVELDVKNLATWLSANAGAIDNVTGYTVYFSDRRGDRVDPAPPASVAGGTGKTGAFGYDDFVNPGDANNGCPDAALNPGEDVESDYTSGVDLTPPAGPRVFGATPTFSNTGVISPVPTDTGVSFTPLKGVLSATGTVEGGSVGTTTVVVGNPTCTAATKPFPFDVVSVTSTDKNATDDLRENPPLLFRRALKIVDGSSISIGSCDGVPCGLTIVSENPVYLQGDYNDPTLDTTFASTDPHVACSIIADAVTLLSDSWNDVNSFDFPYVPGSRAGSTTLYRTAIIGGKGIPFVDPGGNNAADFGTDGGMHNFLRYLESWSGTLYYHGSIVSFFYSHQAVGTYKCCNTIYGPPTRGYKFDTEFLTPSLLPPRTPMLRSVNTISFSQILVPTQQQ